MCLRWNLNTSQTLMASKFWSQFHLKSSKPLLLESGWTKKPIKPDLLSFIKDRDSQLMFSIYNSLEEIRPCNWGRRLFFSLTLHTPREMTLRKRDVISARYKALGVCGGPLPITLDFWAWTPNLFVLWVKLIPQWKV